MSKMNDSSEIMHSKWSMASYGAGSLIGEFREGVLVLILFFFYEVEIGLQSWMTGLALGIYAVWDAFNDPIIGYISDRPYWFTKKWGRRFPWVLVFFVPMLVAFLMIFNPPAISAQEQPWTIFGWLVLSTCLFDTFETFTTCNFFALFPEKFSSQKERINASAITVYVGFVGVVLANVIPPIIIILGNLGSYALLAWICVGISLVSWVLWLPGMRDDKAKVEKYLVQYKQREKQSFFKTLGQTLKHKAFLAYLLFYILYQTLTTTVQGSFLYWVQYIIKGSADDILFVMILLLLGGIAGMPIWILYNRRKNDNRKTMIYAAIGLIALTAVLSFIVSLNVLYVLIFFWGVVLGGFWVMLNPVFSDVIDESITIMKRRQEGFYGGFRSFMGNLAKVMQAFILATVHELTGFVEGATTQPPLALVGIQLHFGIIPAIAMGLGLIIFSIIYDITPEKSKIVKEKLMELNL